MQFKFDDVSESFIGTLENLNGDVALGVLAKVRVFNRDDCSMEYGPTPLKDL